MTGLMTRAEFIQRYPPAGPRREAANPDELKKLDTSDGVQQLCHPPANAQAREVPSKKGDEGCHLWVLDEEGLPYLLERAEVAAGLQSGVIKHTNLTGGGEASCGGELWVDPVDDRLLYVNGCSGRYGPRTAEQLEDFVTLLAQDGFDVQSFGWDEDANRPAMVRR